MEGYEATLPQACQLLSRQILMPKLDEKQLARLKGSAMGMRQQRKDNVSILNEALRQYMLYGEKSDYIKELTDKEIYELQISELTGDINRASNYEAKVILPAVGSYSRMMLRPMVDLPEPDSPTRP